MYGSGSSKHPYEAIVVNVETGGVRQRFRISGVETAETALSKARAAVHQWHKNAPHMGTLRAEIRYV